MERKHVGHPAGLWISSRPISPRRSFLHQTFLARSPLTKFLFIFFLVSLIYLGCGLYTAPLWLEISVFGVWKPEAQEHVDKQSLALPAISQSGRGIWTGDSVVGHMDCNIDRQHLASVQQRYGLEHKIRYLKRYVRFHRKPDVARKTMTRICQPFLESEFRTIDIRKKHAAVRCDPPLEVDVTTSGTPSSVNASIFMFGISTTYARLMDVETNPMEEWVFWLTDGHGRSNGAKLILMLLDASDAQLQEIANMLEDAGVDVHVHHSESSRDTGTRYLNLIPVLFNYTRTRSSTWLVLCDDDTFFPHMHALVERFHAFDASVPLYIGTLSEDVFSVERHGSQAFGGGGIFISLPLAEIVTNFFDRCTSRNKIHESDTGWGPQGDILLGKCIYENTEVRLKPVWDLWQLDIMGDASGFYEWGQRPLSIHHYRGGEWPSAKPLQFTKLAHTCGEDCSLQRFMAQDGFVLSGHSVAYYPEGTDFDWDMIERTMDTMPKDKGWNFDFMFGPQRPSLSRTGRKVAWDLQESQIRDDGSVLQTYIRRWDDWRWMYPDDSPLSSLDGILELVWVPA